MTVNTMDERYVSYLRVSTDRQGRSGLGLEAQREAVTRFLNGGSWKLLGEFVEVESGKANDRPQLAAALNQCRLTGATLLVAKLDRLARNARFLLSIVEGSGMGGVVFCDLPHLPPGPVGKFMVTQMAAVAELEAGLIGQRTKAALAEARKRGVRLGGYRGGLKADPAAATRARQEAAEVRARALGPTLKALQAEGLSLARIASELAAKGIRTPRGGLWTAAAVRSLLLRASSYTVSR
jgi:DNA invertase Pin-like site-specific DNA recombinase